MANGFVSEQKADIVTARILALSTPPAIGIVTLSTTPVELRLDKFDRKGITLDNDTSYIIYVGFTDVFDRDDTITVLSGNSLTINFLNDFNVWATLEEGTTTTKIYEVN